MTTAYDRDLRQLATSVAKQNGMVIRDGVYCYQTGPFFETVAECRMMHRMGADVAGVYYKYYKIITLTEDFISRRLDVSCLKR